MLVRWRVSHKFADGVVVRNPIKAYANLGISLDYDGNKLTCVVHELDCDNKLEPSKVISISKERLNLFWELLRYRRGVSLPDIDSVAQKVPFVDGSPITGTGVIDVAVRALICSSIDMPKPKVFSEVSGRLFVWLRLMNDASDSKDAAYAIRNYYMVWEDLHPGWEYKKWPKEARELKFVRDFVSHAKVNSPNLLDFIESGLRQRCEQFDPTDNAQQQFVSSHRNSARSLIEKELNQLL